MGIQDTNSPLHEALAGGVHAVAFTVGSESGNAITPICQLQDEYGNDLGTRAACAYYVSDDANGDSVAATAPSGGIAVGTDGVLQEWTANLSGLATSESDGDIDITITQTGVDTFYLVFVLASGKLAASGAITFS